MEIKSINHGIACRIGNKIYLNKRLNNYPLLLKRILKHEQAHSSGFGKRDLLIDLTNKHLKGFKREYYSFILNNPSSWTEFLPFGFYDGRFALSPIMLSFWIFFTLIIVGICLIPRESVELIKIPTRSIPGIFIP